MTQKGLRCDGCGREIRKCDGCGKKFKNGDDIYCIFISGSYSHYCDSCGSEANAETIDEAD